MQNTLKNEKELHSLKKKKKEMVYYQHETSVVLSFLS